MRLTLFSFALCLVLVVGCSDTEQEKPARGQELPEFVIGLIPEQNIFRQLERYEFLTRYLSQKTGAPVKLKVLTRYGNVIDNFVSAGLDAAFFGSFTYALAHEKLGVQVIARPVNLNGTATYHGFVFVRQDSGIKGTRDMKGKIFAFVDKATTAGYLLPLAYFKENGIENYQTFFNETYFAGTHEAAIYDVLNKKADIGAAKNTVFSRLAQADSRVREELTLLARSPDVPENGLAVRKDLDPAFRNNIKNVLLTMDTDPEGLKVLQAFGAQRFIETDDRDYANVYNIVEEIGLNLITYDYMND